MKIGKAKPKGIAGYPPPRKKGDPKEEGYVYGKPKTYRKEYCQSIVEYFRAADSWEINYDLKQSGKVLPKSKLPTFERYAADLGISIPTLYLWRTTYPEFAEAYAIAKDLQKAFLMELGAAGVGNHTLALMLRTNHGMKDAPEEGDGEDGPIQRVVVEVVGACQHKGD